MAEKKDLWAILNYELQMYFGVVDLQISDENTRDPHNLKLQNAVMTSGLTEVKILHTRVLIEMFLPRKPGWPDDLNIDDLVPEWRDQHLDLVEALDHAHKDEPIDGYSVKDYLDKFLAHATKLRGDSLDWKPIDYKMTPHLENILATLKETNLPMLAYFRRNPHKPTCPHRERWILHALRFLIRQLEKVYAFLFKKIT